MIPNAPVQERIAHHASCFAHPPSVLNFWRSLVSPVIGRQPTPFYLFSVTPIRQAVDDLDRASRLLFCASSLSPEFLALTGQSCDRPTAHTVLSLLRHSDSAGRG